MWVSDYEVQHCVRCEADHVCVNLPGENRSGLCFSCVSIIENDFRKFLELELEVRRLK